MAVQMQRSCAENVAASKLAGATTHPNQIWSDITFAGQCTALPAEQNCAAGGGGVRAELPHLGREQQAQQGGWRHTGARPSMAYKGEGGECNKGFWS